MDKLSEVFSDFTIINSARRLRGALLHAARICRQQGKVTTARLFERKARQVPRKMDKEAINYVLVAICQQYNIRRDDNEETITDL